MYILSIRQGVPLGRCDPCCAWVLGLCARSVDFFQRVGGWWDCSGRSYCNRHARVLGNNSWMFWNASWLIYAQSVCLKKVEQALCSPVLYVVNFVLSFARFILWKRRNLMRYEKKMVNIDRSIKWLKMDLIYYINILSNTKILKKSKPILEILLNHLTM